MEPHARATRLDDEAGIGLIEIVVSMFMLALVTVSFLPVLVQGLNQSVRTANIATANQLLGRQMDELRGLASNCAAVSVFDDVAVATTTDDRGTVFQPHRTVAACPSTYPGVVRVRSWVTESGKSYVFAEATTLVYVETAAP